MPRDQGSGGELLAITAKGAGSVPWGLAQLSSVRFSPVAQSRPTLFDPMDCSTPDLPVHHQLPELAQAQSEWVMPANHLILCRPLLLPPSVFSSFSVFSNTGVEWIALRLEQPNEWEKIFANHVADKGVRR